MSRFDVSGMVRQDFVDALNLAWLLCGGAGSIALKATLCESAKIVVMHSMSLCVMNFKMISFEGDHLKVIALQVMT